MKLVVLLLFIGTIAGNNDTWINEIPVNVQANTVQPKEEIDSTNNRTVHDIIVDAVQTYLEENWERCVDEFNTVIHAYKVYRRMTINCREKCKAKTEGTYPIFAENIEDIHFYERKVKETLCLLVCDQDYREIVGSKALKALPHDLEQKVKDYHAYEYLHICYYKLNRYQEAANSVFTFLVKHPEHKSSVESLKYYLTLPEVKEDQVVNLESPPYVTMYYKGILEYENEDYKGAVRYFEASLRSYMESEEECRLYCEGPFDQGWHPAFTASIANHFTYCLKCKRSCSRNLNNVNGEYRNDMLKSHYNYLQFSYYKLGKLKEACAAVESYLLFDPADGTMLKNKDYYRALPKTEEEYFAPRQEALPYIKRQTYEVRLLQYISQEFSAIEKRLLEKKKKKNKQKRKKKEAEEKELGKVTNGKER